MDAQGGLLGLIAKRMEGLGQRQNLIAENVANAYSTAESPGGEPYRRRLVSFGNVLDRVLGVEKVEVKSVFTDKSDFGRRFDPGHPAANADGYVLALNVNTVMEMSDMREAQRSYEANLKAIQAARLMLRETLQILRL